MSHPQRTFPAFDGQRDFDSQSLQTHQDIQHWYRVNREVRDSLARRYVALLTSLLPLPRVLVFTAESNLGAGSRRIEVTEEHQLYSASTVFFRQEPGEQHSRRATSLGPPTVAMDEDDRFSSDVEPDHEDEGSSHADARRVRDPLRYRRRATLDSHNFHSGAVRHHSPTIQIPPPNYIPNAENTSGDSRTSSAATLSSTRLTPPSDRASPPRSNSDTLAQPNPPTAHRDRGIVRGATVPGAGSLPLPPTPASRKRASQALEDFRRALIRSSFNPVTSHRSHQPTLSRIDTNIVASPISSPLYTPSNEGSSRFLSVTTPSETSGGGNSRRKSRRFSFSAISNAIRESLKLRSPLIPKKKVEEPPVSVSPHDGENIGEAPRGRSKEKGKRVSRQAFVKVSEVFGLEPEEGKEFGDGWKEFKKGVHLRNFPKNPQSLTAV